MRQEKFGDYEQTVIDRLYKQGETKLAQRSAQMIEDALWFYAYRDDDTAMMILSEIFERSAKNIAKSVERHPEYFPELRITPPEMLPTPDQLNALRILAMLSVAKEPAVFKKWEEQKWPAWKVYEEVAALKHRKPRHSKEKRVIPRATVERKNGRRLTVTDEGDGQLLDGIGGEYEVRLYEPDIKNAKQKL